LATASAQVCVPLGHSSLYFRFVRMIRWGHMTRVYQCHQTVETVFKCL